MSDTKHIWRVSLLVLFALFIFIIGRLLLIPESFGLFGTYRWNNIAQQKAFPAKYLGVQSCDSCHVKEYRMWKANAHKVVTCENCHGPAVSHFKNGQKTADMEINRSANFCLRCHRKMVARPADFVQIDLNQHLAEEEVKYSEEVCITCHNPHDLEEPEEDAAPADEEDDDDDEEDAVKPAAGNQRDSSGAGENKPVKPETASPEKG